MVAARSPGCVTGEGRWIVTGSWISNLMFEHPKECDLDTLDNKFLRGNEVWIERMLRLQKRFAVTHNKALQRRLAIKQGRDDFVILRLAKFQHHDVAGQDASTEHG